MKRKALGTGLSSLIPQAPVRTPSPVAAPIAAPPVVAAPPGLAETRVDIDRIRPNPRQPRRDFDEVALEELARSLKADGLLQPVIVRPADDGRFELVAGERRWRAAQRAGLLKIPAIVRDVPDERLLELALIENLQREELNAIEEAQAYRVLIEDLKLTQQEVADRVGKQRSTVANALRLLQLAPKVQAMVRDRSLSMGHARAIASLASAGEQLAIAERAVKQGLSVRQVETLVARAAQSKSATSAGTDAMPRDPNVDAAEEKLQRALGTKVRIHQGAKGGRIEVFAFSQEELERVYELLLSAGRRKGP